MSAAQPTPQVRVHQDWLGMVQPTGLFLAPRVLADAGATPTEPIIDLQKCLEPLVATQALRDPWAFFTEILKWPAEYLHRELPPELTLILEGGVRLVPDFGLRDLDEPRYVLLGKIVDEGVDLDKATDDDVWTASPHQRFERLLRGRDCPVGVITNSSAIRIVYAPKGEATAYTTWVVGDLVTVAGRPLLAALDMCLNVPRLLTLPTEKRLPALLLRSREFQNTVSTALQGQVLDALQDLLDGIQRADSVTGGRLLSPWRGSDDDRQIIYRGLVTALMRMVFVLFAEERRLLPLDAALYRESYSLTDLHKRLQADHAHVGAGLDARYGAWARVIALFRLLHDGVDAHEIPDGFFIPPRRGDFFDPDRFPFLEGRSGAVAATSEQGPLEVPKIPDGVVYRALDKLLVLGGERLKYSDLAVEQIGSVYEGIMGYALHIAEGRALRLRLSSRETGTLDVVLDLQKFNDLPRDAFLKHLKDDLALKPTDATEKALKKAKSEDDVRTALASQRAYQNVTSIAHGWMYLQPGHERRRSGSHYTPRSLTEPIVARTLAPVLARLGEHPTPDAILGLKVCDPAMGSGAFLVEACRQLAAKLEEAWLFHNAMPEIPPDEDPHLHARRRVAQRCLYGVDRNPLAVDLARLSLWLETFARDHAFTFVDHCLRYGDSLVGLSLDQIASVSLDTRVGTQLDLVRDDVNRALLEVRRLRREIHAAGDGDPPDNSTQQEAWRDVQRAVDDARTLGNLVVAGFFSQKSDRDRKTWLAGQHAAITEWMVGDTCGSAIRQRVRKLIEELALVPFHWPLEFPEVFEGEHPGFDAFVGNPPFVGGSKISGNLGAAYLEWLKALHEGTHGNADLVAHFFRRAFNHLRDGGAFGLIATNTIAQGDTRSTGLRWICAHGGAIYDTRRRYVWPGVAAVVVTVVHVYRGDWRSTRWIDGRAVDEITAFLFHRGGSEDPSCVTPNEGTFSKGVDMGGQGYTFDDREKKRDVVNSLADMNALIAKDKRNAERIFPLLGGVEINEDPEQKHHRYVMNFGEMTENEARRWPDLMAIVEAKVKPERLRNNRDSYRKYWWQFSEKRTELFRALRGKSRVLVTSQTSSIRAFAFVDAAMVFSQKVVVFPIERSAFFAILQSWVHVDWAAFFGSTMKDDPVYTASDCFETFPFPPRWETNAALEDIGKRYDEHRAAMMKRTVGTKKPEGLTATYNRFHDPNERRPDVVTLRALHAEMDRTVLDAYGWQDIHPVYDYRVQLDERTRYTWDEATHDEVLARLLEENRKRAGTVVTETTDAPTRKAKGKKGDGGQLPTLPGME